MSSPTAVAVRKTSSPQLLANVMKTFDSEEMWLTTNTREVNSDKEDTLVDGANSILENELKILLD